MDLILCGLAMVLGIFAAVFPTKAAKMWGSKKLAKVTSKEMPLFLRWYRIFGILLFLAGAIIAADCILFPPKYNH